MDMFNKQLFIIKQSIRSIPNYPKPGILFRDITGLLENPCAYSYSVALLANHYCDYKFTKIVGIEARGFLFSAPIALLLKLGYVLVRKPGKLPRTTIQENYLLEYGIGCLEMHNDSIISGDKVLIVDDVLATGGTVEATAKMIRRLGGEVCDAAFLINLKNLGGSAFLKKIGIKSYSLLSLSSN